MVMMRMAKVKQGARRKIVGRGLAFVKDRIV